MPRELRPDLFKDFNATEQTHAHPLQVPFQGMELERKVRNLGENFEALLRRMETFETQFDQMTKNINLRIERTTTMISHLQTQINHISNDINEKIAQLSAKLNERRLSESRTEDLFEQHNTLIKALEGRLLQMHRMFSEQESQIQAVVSSVNGLRIENRRLQRTD